MEMNVKVGETIYHDMWCVLGESMKHVLGAETTFYSASTILPCTLKRTRSTFMIEIKSLVESVLCYFKHQGRPSDECFLYITACSNTIDNCKSCWVADKNDSSALICTSCFDGFYFDYYGNCSGECLNWTYHLNFSKCPEFLKYI